MIYYDTYKDFLGHHYTAKNPAASMVLIRPRPLTAARSGTRFEPSFGPVWGHFFKTLRKNDP